MRLTGILLIIVLAVQLHAADKATPAAIAFNFAATVADVELTHYAIAQNGCHEANPLSPWQRPTRMQMYSFNLPVSAFAAWLDARRASEGKHRGRFSLFVGAAHSAGIGYSFSTGCLR